VFSGSLTRLLARTHTSRSLPSSVALGSVAVFAFDFAGRGIPFFWEGVLDLCVMGLTPVQADLLEGPRLVPYVSHGSSIRDGSAGGEECGNERAGLEGIRKIHGLEHTADLPPGSARPPS
jgi:hypothetical protein